MVNGRNSPMRVLSILVIVDLFRGCFALPKVKLQYGWYHTGDEIHDELVKLQGSCSDVDFKLSSEIRPAGPDLALNLKIDVVHISQGSKEGKTKAFFVFGEHARELISPESGLVFLRSLCGQGDAIDRKALKRVLSTTSFVVVPNANPLGRKEVESGKYCKRSNEDGVDLNRNWGNVHRNGDRNAADDEMNPGPRGFSEAESQFIKDLLTDEKPDLFLSVHSGAYLLGTPYGYTASKRPDDEKELLSMLKPISQRFCNGECPFGNVAGLIGYKSEGCDIDYVKDELQVPYVYTWEIYAPSEERKMYAEKAKAIHEHRNMSSVAEQFFYMKSFSFLEKEGEKVSQRLRGRSDREFQKLRENEASDCFSNFNPVTQEETEEVTENWAAAFLAICDEIANGISETEDSGADDQAQALEASFHGPPSGADSSSSLTADMPSTTSEAPMTESQYLSAGDEVVREAAATEAQASEAQAALTVEEREAATATTTTTTTTIAAERKEIEAMEAAVIDAAKSKSMATSPAASTLPVTQFETITSSPSQADVAAVLTPELNAAEAALPTTTTTATTTVKASLDAEAFVPREASTDTGMSTETLSAPRQDPTEDRQPAASGTEQMNIFDKLLNEYGSSAGSTADAEASVAADNHKMALEASTPQHATISDLDAALTPELSAAEAVLSTTRATSITTITATSTTAVESEPLSLANEVAASPIPLVSGTGSNVEQQDSSITAATYSDIDAAIYSGVSKTAAKTVVAQSSPAPRPSDGSDDIDNLINAAHQQTSPEDSQAPRPSDGSDDIDNLISAAHQQTSPEEGIHAAAGAHAEASAAAESPQGSFEARPPQHVTSSDVDAVLTPSLNVAEAMFSTSISTTSTVTVTSSTMATTTAEAKPLPVVDEIEQQEAPPAEAAPFQGNGGVTSIPRSGAQEASDEKPAPAYYSPPAQVSRAEVAAALSPVLSTAEAEQPQSFPAEFRLSPQATKFDPVVPAVTPMGTVISVPFPTGTVSVTPMVSVVPVLPLVPVVDVPVATSSPQTSSAQGTAPEQTPMPPRDARNAIAAAVYSGASEFTAKTVAAQSSQAPRPSDAIDVFNAAHPQTLPVEASSITNTKALTTQAKQWIEQTLRTKSQLDSQGSMDNLPLSLPNWDRSFDAPRNSPPGLSTVSKVPEQSVVPSTITTTTTTATVATTITTTSTTEATTTIILEEPAAYVAPVTPVAPATQSFPVFKNVGTIADLTDGLEFLRPPEGAIAASSPTATTAPQQYGDTGNLFDRPLIRPFQPSPSSEEQREWGAGQVNIAMATTSTTTSSIATTTTTATTTTKTTTTTTTATTTTTTTPATTVTTTTTTTTTTATTTRTTITTTVTVTTTSTTTTMVTTTVQEMHTQHPLQAERLMPVAKFQTKPTGLELSNEQADLLNSLETLPVLVSTRDRKRRMRR